MILKTIATGSSGNSYTLIHNNKILLIDLGVSAGTIKQAIDYRISDVVGCLVSHGHQDHVKSASDFERMGIPVWKPYLKPKKIQKRKFGSFNVTCFDVPHDNVENRGFIIECSGEKLLYATDFEYIPYSFRKQKIKHFLIEANYDKDLIDNEAANASHVYLGHAEIHTTIDILKDNADSLRNVILCHTSDLNNDVEKTLGEVEKAVPRANVCVAEAGVVVEL